MAGGSGCPNFLTGAGGFLQSVWAGLAGVRVHHDRLTILPTATPRPVFPSRQPNGFNAAPPGGVSPVEARLWALPIIPAIGPHVEGLLGLCRRAIKERMDTSKVKLDIGL